MTYVLPKPRLTQLWFTNKTQKPKNWNDSWFWKSDFELWPLILNKPKIRLLIEPTASTSRLPENWLRQFAEFPAPKNNCPENHPHWSQLAEKHQTKEPREQRTIINHWLLVIKHNARLRGWQRTAELKKHTVNSELQFCTKAATRWQSLLSRLLAAAL